MKALTVKQPWAHLIRLGEKRVEVRSWPTKYRGELLITSSAKPHMTLMGVELSTGVTECVVNLLDCRPFLKKDARNAWCDYWPEQYAWDIRLLYRVAPVAVKGKVGLWAPPAGIIRRVK